MTIQEQLLCAILDCDETELDIFIDSLRKYRVDVLGLVQDAKEKGLDPANLEDLKITLNILMQ